MEKAGNAFVELDTSAAEDRRIVWILNYWKQLPRPAGQAGSSPHFARLPAPKEIDPLDIPPFVLPHIFQISIDWSDGAPRFVYRLSGTNLTKEYDREITGKSPRTAFPTYYRDLEAGYAVAAARSAPILHRYRMPIYNREHKWVERLTCPFSSDGNQVDLLFGCLVFP